MTDTWRLDPVRYPEKGLIVKWGRDVTIAEGQCLQFIRKHLADHVPVPEVFGWTQDGDVTYLYLESIFGDPLSERWDTLTKAEKATICNQLCNMIHSWRRIQPPRAVTHKLSQLGGQPLRDIHFSDAGSYPTGPFKTTSDFHDAYASLSIPSRSIHYGSKQPRVDIEELAGLTDDVNVVFTHADLDLSNILISKTDDGPTRIVSIIDWHQSGWYPEPWEWCKAQVVSIPHSEWVTEYLDTVLPPPELKYRYSWKHVCMSTI